MYRQVLAEAALDRGWVVHRFDASTIEQVAVDELGDGGAHLTEQRSILGPPWNKDHRVAFAAAIVAARAHAGG